MHHTAHQKPVCVVLCMLSHLARQCMSSHCCTSSHIQTLRPMWFCCWLLQGPAPSVYQEQQLQQQQQQLQHHQQQQQRSGDTEALQLNVSMSPHHVTPIAEPMNAPSLPVSQDPAGTNLEHSCNPCLYAQASTPCCSLCTSVCHHAADQISRDTTSTTSCQWSKQQHVQHTPCT